jgi:hypothetical protein
MSIKNTAAVDAGQAAPEQEVAVTDSAQTLPESDQVIQLPAGSLAYDLVQKLRELPYEKQREVRDFVEFLLSRMSPKRPRRSLMGMLAHLNIHISSEDIAEARREMWGNFPRDFPDE